MLRPDEVDAILSQRTIDAPNVSEADERLVNEMFDKLQEAIGPAAYWELAMKMVEENEAEIRRTDPDCQALKHLAEWRAERAANSWKSPERT